MRSQHKIRKWARRLAALGAILFLAGVWAVGSKMTAPANRRVDPPEVRFPIAPAVLEEDGGTQVAAWHAEHPASKAVVVLVHPIRANRRAMLTRATLFYEAGYSVVLIDLQAHGETPGDQITMGWLEQRDVQTAVAFARRRFSNQRIVVLGWSLGGAAAVLGSPLEIDALILESVYPTITRAAGNRIERHLGPLHHVLTPVLLAQLPLRLGISSDALQPIDSLALAACPVLIMSGGEDQHTTAADTRDLFSAAREPKELVMFPSAAHVDLFSHDPALYRLTVLRFLDRHLQSRVASPISDR